MGEIIEIADLKIIMERERKEGKKIVFTNGCFDLLHVGHIRYLKKAKELGDLLVVGLNSDSSVRGIKGAQRPIIPQGQRAEIVSSLEMVDYVLIFDDFTPYYIIKEIQPDILVKGADWDVDEIVGKEIVEKRGGKVIAVELVNGVSTSDIIKRIKNGNSN